MPRPPAQEKCDDDLDRIIADYLEAGRFDAAAQSRVLSLHPEAAEQLRQFFANHDRMRLVADPLRPTVGLSTATHVVWTPSRIGDYELIGEIARGGMGVVYKARQVSLNRTVAIKMILSGRLASAEDIRRFRCEAEAAAGLDHPGIVPVYGADECDGQHYFAMGYVDGVSLADRLREGPLAAREAAAMLREIATAVQYAHDRGIVHRDLKPANILLEQYIAPECSSSVSAIPRPRVTDFGLAKWMARGTDLTIAGLGGDLTGTGQILGTPGYMSPEQAAGGTDRIGPTSDVYSLGAILYCQLTGRPPFQAETPVSTIMQVLDCEPLPPRLLNPGVPADLEAVCMKCLQKDPHKRYPSARNLAEDLNRFLSNERVEAGSIHVLDRIVSAIHRSGHEEHFLGWSRALTHFGAIIFLAHALIFVLRQRWPQMPEAQWLTKAAMFAALLAAIRYFRPHSVLPTNSAERVVWVVWIGYLAGVAAVNAVAMASGQSTATLYPTYAVLSGVGFMTLGGHVWGGGYVIGTSFMVAAPLLAVMPTLAPLLFGGLWLLACWSFALHYWRRRRE